jgi:DeoR family deoxyribose operon repressor
MLKGIIVDKDQRIKHIINMLKIKNVVTLKELTYKLNVSEMTVRRDLGLLAKDNIVHLIPGGAILKEYIEYESDEEKYPIYHEETKRTREKIKIGKKAASLIEPNDTITIDVGSTTEYMVKFIREDLPVTILCYALNILVEIYRKKNCSPIFAGGYFHDNTLMFESQEGIHLINRTRCDKAFMSAAGIHGQLGVTCANLYEIETKMAVLKSAKTKILLADSEKFGKAKIAYFAEMKNFDIIITNSEIPDEYKKLFDGLGRQLILV